MYEHECIHVLTVPHSFGIPIFKPLTVSWTYKSEIQTTQFYNPQPKNLIQLSPFIIYPWDAFKEKALTGIAVLKLLKNNLHS